jgi:hypothetical protein
MKNPCKPFGELMMKKMIAALALTALIAGTANAQDPVTSVNAVGMVKNTVLKGELALVTIPFNSGSPLTPSTLFGDSLPYQTKLFYWDSAEQGYVTITYKQGSFGQPDGWDPDTKVFTRGEGFFVQIPETAAQNSYNIVFSGEVPGNDNNETTDVTIVTGFQLVGFSYPVEMQISDPDFNIQPVYNDKIYTWNGGWSISTYKAGSFGQPDGWDNPSLTLIPGQGFFYFSESDKTWTVTKDNLYIWP